MRAEVEKGLPGLEGDRRFHLGVAVAAHNPLLLRLLKGLRVALDRTSETSLTRPGQPARSLEEHRGVVEAIRAGDAADAANKMLAHLVGTTDELVRR